MVLSPTQGDRVRANTVPEVNRRIDEQIERNILGFVRLNSQATTAYEATLCITANRQANVRSGSKAMFSALQRVSALPPIATEIATGGRWLRAIR